MHRTVGAHTNVLRADSDVTTASVTARKVRRKAAKLFKDDLAPERGDVGKVPVVRLLLGV